MVEGKRTKLSATEKNEIWRRWKAARSMHGIGRAFGRPHPTIRKLLMPSGGIAALARRRLRLALTLTEREDISRGIAAGSSIRENAQGLSRATSTVSREIVRHGGRPAYRAHDADGQAWESALRPKRCLRSSLTWDRGLEMDKHKEFTAATNVQVYFCDPQSPWQRGTNENTNLLLRQYFPRGTDLAPITQAQLDQVELRLNPHPRKTLGFQTPASKLQTSVASTV